MARKDGIPTARQKEEGIHVKNLFSIAGGLMWAILNKIASKVPANLADDLNNDSEMIDAMVQGALEYKANKFMPAKENRYQMTVATQLMALRRANDEEGWGITEETFTRLAFSAPEWPRGRHSYRSFRIRFGEGSEGVASTFERHVARIKSVFTEKGFWRWEYLHSTPVVDKGYPVERIRLLAGNDTHHAVVEWVIVDLDTHRQRESVEAVRGPDSLADELLIIAWMFPQMIKDIDCDELPSLFAAGYEVNVLERVGDPWGLVVLVEFDRLPAHRQVRVRAQVRDNCSPSHSVPVCRKNSR